MKILIIRFSSLGDIILTTPVVRCLKRQLEGAEIHYLTKVDNLELLYNTPNIDKVLAYDGNLRETVKKLRNENYDAIVDLHNSRRSSLIRMQLKGKKYVYRKENLHKWLTIVTKHDFMSGKNVVERYLAAVKPLGIEDDGGGLELMLPESMAPEVFKKLIVAGKKVEDIVNQPYVVVACGSQHETKNIPVDKLMVLCSMIKMRVVLLGDKKDRKRIRDWGASFSANVINLCGKTSLLESAAFVRAAAVVISPDSAMMHFAVAFHRPLIAIWGATTPRFGFAAFRTPHADCEVTDLWCRPCSRMGSKRCPLGHFRCMHEQSWQRIAESVTKITQSSNNQAAQ